MGPGCEFRHFVLLIAISDFMVVVDVFAEHLMQLDGVMGVEV